MKLKLHVSCHLLNVTNKFQVDTFKFIQKVQKTLKKSKTWRNNCQNAKNIFFKEKNLCQEVYRELPMKYTEGYLCTEFDGIILTVFYLKFFEHPSFGQVAHETYPSEWKVHSSEISITIMYCWYMFLMAVATDLTHVTILI